MKPNRFSGLADRKPRTPRGGPRRGLLGLIRFGLHGSGVPSRVFVRQIPEKEFQKCEDQPSYLPSFGSHREISWLGFMVLGLGFAVFLQILEREFQKCGA